MEDLEHAAGIIYISPGLVELQTRFTQLIYTSYIQIINTPSSSSHGKKQTVSLSAGFDLLQDLQGQAGGGFTMSPCPDDGFLFQTGGVERCLTHIDSVFLDS